MRKFVEELEHFRFTGEERTTWPTAVTRWRPAADAGLKPKVVKRYAVSLRQCRGILDPLYLDEITERTLAKVVADRRKTGATNATIKRDLTAVSSVLRFCKSEGLIERNPARDYDRDVVRERRDPIVLPLVEDIDAVIGICPGNFAKLCRQAQFTGARQEELGSLERPEIRRLGRVMDLVKGKTDRPRAVGLDERAWGTIEGTPAHLHCPYVFWHETAVRKPDGRLERSADRYLNISSRFAGIMARAVENGLVKRRFRFHDLRHWYAVDFLRRGAGTIYTLQKLLGHASIKTTEIYLDYLTPDEQDRAKGGTFGGTVAGGSAAG